MSVHPATASITSLSSIQTLMDPRRSVDESTDAPGKAADKDTVETASTRRWPTTGPFGCPRAGALPLFRSARHAETIGRFAERRIPYFFLRDEKAHAAPLSGLLNPRCSPMGPKEPRWDTDDALTAAEGAHAFAALNDALNLHQTKGILVMHLDDGHFSRLIPLLRWQDLTHAPRACAIVNCLVRLSPQVSWHMSDSELLCNSLAAACLMAGCMVRRDIAAAEILLARVPTESKVRAQALTQDYVSQHDLWPLKPYLEPEAGLFGPLEQPAAWQEPRRWPVMAKNMALWLLDISFFDQED